MASIAVPPHGMISPEPTGFVDVIRTQPSTVSTTASAPAALIATPMSAAT